MLGSVGVADTLSRRSRRRKLELFLETFQPGPGTTVLDIGAADAGYGEPDDFATYNFLEEFYPWPEQITAVGLGAGAVFQERYPGTRYVEADGCSLPFADREFDLYFSNAVIEHLGSRERQVAFVSEALRVARGVFLTTPNRWFPLELHTRLPLVHWLPKPASSRAYALLRAPGGRELDLLGPRGLRGLFPNDTPVRVINNCMTLVALVERTTNA